MAFTINRRYPFETETIIVYYYVCLKQKFYLANHLKRRGVKLKTPIVIQSQWQRIKDTLRKECNNTYQNVNPVLFNSQVFLEH